MDIQDLRQQIDFKDDQLVSLFGQRMDIAAQIADYKKENNLPIHVFGLDKSENIYNVIMGAKMGTVVKGE